MNKEKAQQRADRIQEFREEIRQLEEEEVLVLTEEQRERIQRYHDSLLVDFSKDYDVDTSSAQKQLSVGMRIISFLGAVAISAAVFFFFYRFWAYFSTTLQVIILVGVTLLATLGIDLAARKEMTHYFANIMALVALACFVLNLTMLGRIFNITPTQNAFLAWAAFSLILAYRYGMRLLLVAGIISLLGYLSATVGTFAGCYWLYFGERPENFIVAGLVLFGLSFIPHLFYRDFPSVYRFLGTLSGFIAILIVANWGMLSYLTLPERAIEHVYQIAGFVFAGFMIWLGLYKKWKGIINLGSVFFTIYLYTKFFDWWWEWMPKYLFFFIVGMVAVLLLSVLRRLRILSREGSS
jgi:uncharacterized membrane protein